MAARAWSTASERSPPVVEWDDRRSMSAWRSAHPRQWTWEDAGEEEVMYEPVTSFWK